jgi:hypothetical protein
MDPTLENVEEMFELVSAISSERIRDALMYEYRTELRSFVHKLETLYFRHYIKKRSVARLESKKTREIAHFEMCMRSLLPLMILVNDAHSMQETDARTVEYI